ncbi:MAG TPA: tRNA (N(6)-L-threonylcarbamoyladenosine(37)-C(2))-methylthiotransferase MtaB [Vicinamibacterales bacterium]|nr:tRNA (N(6)-L-threonylcarbamoyladenosine(37)-C(2))-methylthiotransferase MtaB [Vicinamibacterales bacterium]
MKYTVITFGCRVNQADSLVIEGALRARGAIDAPPDQADLVIVNTCSVTASADQGARQTIRRIARSNPDVRVVVTGCYATRRPDELRELPNVVRVIPNPDKDDLVALLDDEAGGDGPCGHVLRPGIAGRTALTLRVQTGCEEACSYCIIPQTRGAGRSTPLAVVIDRIRAAVDAGYKEVAITGVHLGSYGRDLGDGSSLSSLVHRLASWGGGVLFRLSSLEPMDCTDDIVDMVAGADTLAPHFHLPLQHAADTVLTRMRRPYTASFYRKLVERIHATMPYAAIGSDLIVGFPGETDDEFSETEQMLSDLPLSHLHVFPYSDRPGTEASEMTGKVDGVVIRERGARLREIGREMVARFRDTQRGTVRRALTVDDGRSAVTDNYIKVGLVQPQARNTWVSAVID